MTYTETLDFLYTHLPMFSRIGPAAYKKDLTNTLALLQALGNPHHRFKSIHIAGTNGKGSTSHMLAAILQEAGYKTGLYTSPHLHDFRERIKVDGKLCDESFVIAFTERIRPVMEQVEPSFFEITVAMAFEYFAQTAVDIAVVETGLGGRLDSTNVLLPELSIITQIGMDHMALLGNTLPEIAGEKAGIIKKGIPVVIGEALPETRPVFEEKARQMNAPIYFAQEHHYVANWVYQHHQLVVEVAHNRNDTHQQYSLDLPGIYQTHNVVTVLEACHQLAEAGWHTTIPTIQSALQKVIPSTGLHGRWETIHRHPSVILDVAHNPDGMQQVVRQLELMSYRQLHIVLGMVKDKDVQAVLALMPRDARYYFTQAQSPRALDPETLAQMAAVYRLSGHTYPAVHTALQEALRIAHKEDLILVCGSVFLVGEVSL